MYLKKITEPGFFWLFELMIRLPGSGQPGINSIPPHYAIQPFLIDN